MTTNCSLLVDAVCLLLVNMQTEITAKKKFEVFSGNKSLKAGHLLFDT